MLPKLLGAPDRVEFWQYYNQTGTRNLYAVARVIEAEASPAFAAVLEQRIKNEADVREVPLIVAIREIASRKNLLQLRNAGPSGARLPGR